MPYLSYIDVTPETNGHPSTSFSTSSAVIEEDTSTIVPIPTSDKRRYHFRSSENRQAVRFGPSKIIQSDFCHGHLGFAQGEGLELSLPMISFDLMKYWDGRPVWFLCCERRKDGGPGPGSPLFCIGFEIIVDNH